LNHELNQESANDQKRGVRRENPKRNQQHPADRRQNDYAPPSPTLRQLTNYAAATNHSERVDNCDLRSLVGIETALLL
jgi:hypothetical protein